VQSNLEKQNTFRILTYNIKKHEHGTFTILNNLHQYRYII